MRKSKIIISLFFIFTFFLVCIPNVHSRELGDIIWQILVPDNPGTTVQDKQIHSLKQIPDVNGDLVNDVIVATGNYWTICYSGLNGSQLWRFNSNFGSINTGSVEWEDAVAISDVNNDGIFDAVIGCAGGNEMVYALNGSNGSVIWSYGNSTTTNDGDIESVNIRYDFNGDGINDVLVAASGTTTGGRHAAICLNALNGQEIFYRAQPQPFTDDILATESGGAIGVNNNGSPYGVNGFDSLGNPRWSYTAPGNIWSLKEFPDINNDGKKDIIGLAGFTAGIFAITGNTGTQIWSRTLGSSNNGKIALLDDADGNGFIDFSLSAPQVAYRIDSKTGNTIWSNTLSSSYLRGVDDIGDVTGDTIDDIAIATQVPARLLVLNGLNGNIIFEHLFGNTITQRGDRAAVLKDIDSNGINEFLGGNREGKVICFSGGDGTITSVNNNNEQIMEYSLSQNYPNPFNPTTKINYILRFKNEKFVTLKIFNAIGKEVATLVNKKQSASNSAGGYTVEWDASNFPSGIYFYTLYSDEILIDTKRMMLLK